MLRLLSVLGALFFASVLYAQKEASIWYFGLRAGLDFRQGSPTVLLDGQLNTMEGVATISDADGNLMFYTDGTKVLNRLHAIMPNGTGLAGHFSSSQSAIAVPMINDPLRYYLFTVDAVGGPNGFNYSIINMSLDSGKGDVEIKNVPLASFVCEKVTAVKHCNGTDIWVLIHRFNSADILAYLVTAAGVNPVPVVSSTGMFVPSTATEYSVGCMKVSPDGSKLAVAHFKLGAEVMNFNNSTGVVSGGGSLFLPNISYGNPSGAYGVEFSPNSKYLYVAGDYYTPFANYLLQYDVTLPDIADIRSSKYIVAWKPLVGMAYSNFGTLQTGPDGKIYLAEVGAYSLSVIDHPNLPGAACGFNYRSLYLQRMSIFGLPSFIQSNFRGQFSYRASCKDQPVFFDYERSPNEVSVKWDYGDPSSGIQNISTEDSSRHIYRTSGSYTVKLIRFTACDSDTLTKVVNITASQFSLGKDSLICGANSYLIVPQLSGTNNSFAWQDGSAGPTFTATQTGIYWLNVTDNENGCIMRDSVSLSFHSYPDFSLGADLEKCEGDIVDLSVDLSPAGYLWNTGSTANSIQVTQQGSYWLEVNNNGCKRSDTVSINFHQFPVVDLGIDTVLCEGEPLILNAGNPGMQYLWENNTTNQQHAVYASGLYWVEVSNYGCNRKDSIQVDFFDKPLIEVKDTTICPGLTTVLVPVIKKGEDLSFLWNTGSSNESIRVPGEGNYLLTVSNWCGSVTKTIRVGPGRCQLFVPSAFTPNGDGLNDVFKSLYGENVVKYNLRVYNRWGEIIFSTKDKAKGWDGRYKGKPQDSGIFLWFIRYNTAADPAEKIMKGTVMLIR